MAEQEIWKPIPGFQWYEASNHGRIRSLDHGILGVFKGTAAIRQWRGRVLKPSPVGKGYQHVILSNRSQRLVHCLVMLAFVGEPPPGKEVAHYDNNPANNCLSNLRYDTPAGNNADKVRHGTHQGGERQGSHKLTSKEVLAIRRSKVQGSILARIYNVSQTTISYIRLRKSWRWLDG